MESENNLTRRSFAIAILSTTMAASGCQGDEVDPDADPRQYLPEANNEWTMTSQGYQHSHDSPVEFTAIATYQASSGTPFHVTVNHYESVELAEVGISDAWQSVTAQMEMLGFFAGAGTHGEPNEPRDTREHKRKARELLARSPILDVDDIVINEESEE